MGSVLTIVGLIAATLLGTFNPWSNNQSAGSQTPNSFSAKEACKPNIDKNRQIIVQVKNGLEGLYGNQNTTTPQFNKNGKKYILVKENAPIPAWKAGPIGYAGFRFNNPNLPYAEMEDIGTAAGLAGNNSNPDVGKPAYIGVGWCNPEDGNNRPSAPNTNPPFNYCLDPLVQDVIYVLTRKGAEARDGQKVSCPSNGDCGNNPFCTGNQQWEWLNCFGWANDPVNQPNPPHTKENLDKYWWTFNVYYDASKLPAEPTYDDLPCWMRDLAENCPGGENFMGDNRRRASTTPNCEAQNVLSFSDKNKSIAQNNNRVLGVVNAQGAPDTDRPQLIIDKNQMNLANVPAGVTIANQYISLQKLTDPPNSNSYQDIGDAYNKHFKVLLQQGTVSGTSADHVLILDPRPAHDGPYWVFAPILATNKPIANSLQLGTFNPGIPSFYYEWWTPSCKPALYFYPPKETAIDVKVLPEGYLTKSIPDYKNGWSIKASPDGKLFNTNNYTLVPNDYLYYEAAIKNVNVNKTNGWIIQKENLAKFFSSLLSNLGLNDKEQNDFLVYWLPKLESGEKWYITLIDPSEIDRVEHLDISPKPDNVIRVRFYFENITNQGTNNITRSFNSPLFSQITNYKLPITKPRSGFTVVDWGGIIGNGSCGLEETSQ